MWLLFLHEAEITFHKLLTRKGSQTLGYEVVVAMYYLRLKAPVLFICKVISCVPGTTILNPFLNTR